MPLAGHYSKLCTKTEAEECALIRLNRKWMKAGVLEEDGKVRSEFLSNEGMDYQTSESSHIGHHVRYHSKNFGDTGGTTE
jgi:hypothetical protein